MNDFLVRAIRRQLSRSLAARLPSRIRVILIPARTSQKLNQTYRGDVRPANVLSFRYSDSYGEILICSSLVRREARERGVLYRNQMTWMVVHGILHLAGVHHEESRIADRKFSHWEKEILKRI